MTDYKADSIKVLEGLEGVRKRFDIVELSRKVKRKGDLLVLSSELKLKPRILKSVIDEGRILEIAPGTQKSKASILASLKTNREVLIFSKKHNFKKISPKKLLDLVKQWKQDIQKNPLLLLSQEEHDLILGSLFGDASIRQRNKNCCFRVSHSFKQREYIGHKLKILENFNISEFRETKRILNNRNLFMINLSTKTHQVFNYYRNLFYNKQGIKEITMKLLNKLNTRSLAYWICDGGSYDNKQGYVVLCTNSFTLREHKLIKEFFNKKFNLDPTIGFRDKKYYYLRFKQEDSKRLIEIIKPFILQSMLYKIGGSK